MTESNDCNDRPRTAIEEWEESRLNQESSLRTQFALSQSPILFREIAGLILLVLVSDLTLYRSFGFAGPATLFAIAPLLLWLGTVRLKYEKSIWVFTPMLIIASIRLIWCGSFLAVLAGFVVLCCFAMCLAGIRPYVTSLIIFSSRVVAAGLHGLKHYAHCLSRFSPAVISAHWFAVALPIFTLATFGTIFVLANPDLVKSFGESLTRFVEFVEKWTAQFQFAEVVFCSGAAWIAVGLLRPGFNVPEAIEFKNDPPAETVLSPLYAAYRNTLAVVIGLFAVYLTFEFQTLWFKTFPKGFHYSGYAHEGAAWLTIALGLATIVLSLIFRGTVLADPRIGRLRTLSWIWSIQNLLLAVAVFNRLFIYIGFNGMTRMRVVGMLGVTSVVIGFVLVLVKISQNRDFTWLIRRQLWTVCLAIYFYAVLPVDAFVNQFNVARIMAGDPAPCVQISVHSTSDEGLLWIKPLINCSDPIIRDGIRAILNEKQALLDRKMSEQESRGWTTTQLATLRLVKQLHSIDNELNNDSDSNQRELDIKKFDEYAYQWY